MNPIDARLWGMWRSMPTTQKRRVLAALKRLVEAQSRVEGGAA